MKKLTLAAVVGSILASSGIQAEGYLGLKVGKSWFDDGCTGVVGCEDDSGSIGVYGGYQFLEFLSLEGGYDMLGEYTLQGVNDDRVHVFSMAPKLSFPVTEKIRCLCQSGWRLCRYW